MDTTLNRKARRALAKANRAQEFKPHHYYNMESYELRQQIHAAVDNIDLDSDTLPFALFGVTAEGQEVHIYRGNPFSVLVALHSLANGMLTQSRKGVDDNESN